MSQIKFTALEYDQSDNLVKYRIIAANDQSMGSLEFYDYPGTFHEFAQKLISFPVSIDDEITFETGENRPPYYMLMRAFCYERNGHTAIQIIMDNHQPCPDMVKTEFYISTIPASINTLGELLFNWDPKKDEELVWEVQARFS
jgi:hypothetical protein